MGDAHKLEIAQFPQGVVMADKPTQFLVRKNGAVGALDAKVSLVIKTRAGLVQTKLQYEKNKVKTG